MIVGVDASRANVLERTGTEWYSYELLSRWPKLRPDLIFRYYMREAPRQDLQGLGSNVQIRVLNWPPKFLWSLLRLSWELLFHRPDVFFEPAHTVPIIHPPKTVVTIHDVGFERFPGLYQRKQLGPGGAWFRILIRLFTFGRFTPSELGYHRFAVRQALKSAQIIVTISEFSKREIVHFFNFPSNRIRVIYLAPQSPPKRALPGKSQFPRSYCLFIGRFEKKKNIANIIHAYGMYRQLIKAPVDLVLVGRPGFGFNEITQSIEQLRLGDWIHFLPWQCPERKNAILANASSFIFVSQYEGFGIPALEAMSAGVPVLASTAGSLPEVCGQAAEYVDPNDIKAIAQGILLVNHNPQRRSQLTSNGYKQAKQFSWDRCALETISLIDQVGKGELQKREKTGRVRPLLL